MSVDQIRYRGFTVHHENAETTRAMCSQGKLFPNFFAPLTERPLIIDCGSNIGVTMLEWKHRWPGAEVICFEPDPRAFRLLQMNVDKNDIPAVRCINAAVDDSEGLATLHGNFHSGSDSRGNSIDPGWGWRPESETHPVKCQLLSRHLVGHYVDFLKLDVEGVEERVLREIEGNLQDVGAMYVEVHETMVTATRNSAERITGMLRKAGFTVEMMSRNFALSLPLSEHRWQSRVGARQVHLLCRREPA